MAQFFFGFAALAWVFAFCIFLRSCMNFVAGFLGPWRSFLVMVVGPLVSFYRPHGEAGRMMTTMPNDVIARIELCQRQDQKETVNGS